MSLISHLRPRLLAGLVLTAIAALAAAEEPVPVPELDPGPGGSAIAVGTYGARCDGATDDTVAFQKAIAAAEESVGAVQFSGRCLVSETLRISRTVTLRGFASGGLSAGAPGWDQIHASSTLVSSADPALLVKSAGEHDWLGGVRLSDFAVEANGGDGIVAEGPDDQHVRNLMISNVIVYYAAGCGYRLTDNVYGFSGVHMMAYRGKSHGVCITGTGHGQVSSVNIFGGWIDLNHGDGLRVSSGADIRLYGGFYADSDGSGIHVTAEARDAHVYCNGCHLESNATSNATLLGGYAHVFDGAFVQGDSKAVNGFYIANTPPNYVTPSVTIRDCEISLHRGADFYIAKGARNVQLYNQAQLMSTYKVVDQGSNTRNYGQ